MNAMKKLLLFLPIVFAISCASIKVHRLNTASGRPEVFIANTTKEKVQGALTDILVSEGAELSDETNSMMKFMRFKEKKLPQKGPFLFEIYENLKFTFLKQKNGIKVFANGLNEFPPSGYQTTPPQAMYSKEDMEMLQGILERLKAKL